MPNHNRVTPFGDIIATPDRGMFMGNRGILHEAEGRIGRAWQVKRWIVCVLEFRGRKRQVMTPGRYTELFLLDEATTLSAGHRPCVECRHTRFLNFCNAWERRTRLTAPRRGPLPRKSTTACTPSGSPPTAPNAPSLQHWATCRTG